MATFGDEDKMVERFCGDRRPCFLGGTTHGNRLTSRPKGAAVLEKKIGRNLRCASATQSADDGHKGRRGRFEVRAKVGVAAVGIDRSGNLLT